MRISPRAGTILTIMVSDHRVITSGQEVIAFLTYVREVKALTSSYLHNERNWSLFVIPEYSGIPILRQAQNDRSQFLPLYSDHEWPKQRKMMLKNIRKDNRPAKYASNNMKTGGESQMKVHPLHHIFTTKNMGNSINKICKYKVFYSWRQKTGK